MMVKFVSRSARGAVRKDNQDNLFCDVDRGVFAVADGMGGGEAGALASQMVCDALKRGVTAADYLTRLDEIGEAVREANAQIFAYARERGFQQMGSTVALLALDTLSAQRAAVGYVGDSRVYRVRCGEAEPLTRDHSVGAELEARVGSAAGSRFALRSNPLAHVLTRAIGPEAKVSLEWRELDVAAGDLLVICSDGVHDVLETREIGRLVADASAKTADVLEREIVRRGAPDNYSFVILKTGGRS